MKFFMNRNLNVMTYVQILDVDVLERVSIIMVGTLYGTGFMKKTDIKEQP